MPRTSLYLFPEDRERLTRLQELNNDGRGVPSLTELIRLLMTREEARLRQEGKLT